MVDNCSFLGQFFLPFLSFPFTFLIDFFLCFFLSMLFSHILLTTLLSSSLHFCFSLHTHFPLLFTLHCSLIVAFSFFSLHCIFQNVLASSMLLVFLGCAWITTQRSTFPSTPLFGSFSFFVRLFIFSLWLFFWDCNSCGKSELDWRELHQHQDFLHSWIYRKSWTLPFHFTLHCYKSWMNLKNKWCSLWALWSSNSWITYIIPLSKICILSWTHP